MRSLSLSLIFLVAVLRSVAAESAADRLAGFMTGDFTNADQARGDQNFRQVELRVIPIWTDRTDGRWLYLEQSLAGAPEHPYKQFVYQLTARDDGAIAVCIYDLPDLVAATGAGKDSAFWTKITPENLSGHDGCLVILRPLPDGSLKGATEGKGCASTVRGASYATTEITVGEKQLVTWERGFNTAGAQVWGSLHGGYEFKKR